MTPQASRVTWGVGSSLTYGACMLKSLAAMGAAISVLGFMPAAQSATQGHNVKSCNTTLHGTVHNVTVQAGDTCIIPADVTVTGGVHAKQGAANLIVQADVAHNIQAKGVTGLVQIGPPNCRFDPLVGNNIHVFKSHHVLICQATVDNNIMVTGNDGQISILDSTAGNNIMVNRNLPMTGPPLTGHRHPEWIRVFRSTAGNHIHEFHNQRHVENRQDSPAPVIK